MTRKTIFNKTDTLAVTKITDNIYQIEQKNILGSIDSITVNINELEKLLKVLK